MLTMLSPCYHHPCHPRYCYRPLRRMPTVTFVNETQVPLNICLKQVSPLHYANKVQPGGGRAAMHTGKVWFTVQVRVDRGDNGYDKFQTYAPIAAITIGVLSLGAGAIYFAGASAAAGGAAAAISAAAARLSAIAATQHLRRSVCCDTLPEARPPLGSVRWWGSVAAHLRGQRMPKARPRRWTSS